MLRLSLAAGAVALGLLSARADDPKPVEVFNGKNLFGWKLKDEKRSNWIVGTYAADAEKPNALVMRERAKDEAPDLVNWKAGGCDIYTEEKFGDVHLELEFMVPKGSNSGIYLMGEYEVQVLDSYGKADDKLTQGDLGALYSAAKPPKNAAKKPGEWQKFVIDFRAPKFEGDKKVANATFVKVVLNDVVLHENVR
jgi:hypothetical protein